MRDHPVRSKMNLPAGESAKLRPGATAPAGVPRRKPSRTPTDRGRAAGAPRHPSYETPRITDRGDLGALTPAGLEWLAAARDGLPER